LSKDSEDYLKTNNFYGISMTSPSTRPNILLITADDMNWDAVGVNGCPTKGTTPNLDRLAKEGMRFEHGHVTIAVCQPSRSAIMTGRYPHKSGGEGFYDLRFEGVPILPDLLRKSGYRVGILGKVGHSTPYSNFEWDHMLDMKELGMGRSPSTYRREMKTFLEDCGEQPFFMMANSHDPHRPFVGNDPREWYDEKELLPMAVPPSRTFTPEEVEVPGFLEDLPDVRLEISEYYGSVRRCDDTIGEIMHELDASGKGENTMVLFLSDNGMAFPFAKTNCYLNSTRTPFLVRWPKEISENNIEAAMVSGVDILPTFLEAAEVPLPEGVQGKSFLSLLKGQSQEGRDWVYTHFNQNYARDNYPMRAVQSSEWLYVYNPWSDGEKTFSNESMMGRTFKAMKEASENDAMISGRIELFLHRVPEELYDLRVDPHARNNLVASDHYTAQLDFCRNKLDSEMEKHEDPVLECFRDRENEEKRIKFMAETRAILGGN